MITKEQWYRHGSFQTDLKALLENPVLETALEICRNQDLIPISTSRTVNLIDYVAIMGSKKEGYNEFLVNLRSLAQPSANLVPAKKAWEYEEKMPATQTGSNNA